MPLINTNTDFLYHNINNNIKEAVHEHEESSAIYYFYLCYVFRSMHTVTNIYIANVAFSDFIISILATPFQAMVRVLN